MEDKLNEQQVDELRQAFCMFDKDNSGSITIDELENVMKSIGITPSKKHLSEMFKMMDSDDSGTINFEEFLTLINGKTQENDQEDDLKKVFQVFDKDGNGYITSAELKQAMESMNERVTDEDIEEMIKEADSNNDGKVNYEEFIKMMKQK